MRRHAANERNHGAMRREKTKASQVSRTLCEPGALPDRDGGVWRCAALGTGADKNGHQVKLTPAEFAKAFYIRNKNDAADARAV